MPANDKLPDLEDLRLLRLPAVLQYVGLSESRIRQLEAAGAFPARVVIGPNSVAWRAIDVRRWLAERGDQKLVLKGAAVNPPRSTRAKVTQRKGT